MSNALAGELASRRDEWTADLDRVHGCARLAELLINVEGLTVLGIGVRPAEEQRDHDLDRGRADRVGGDELVEPVRRDELGLRDLV